MYIQFTRDYVDPDTKELLGRQTERLHVPQSVGENLIFRKVAQRCSRPAYGTAEWVAERQSADTQRVPFGSVDPNVVGVQWGIKPASDVGYSQATIVKRAGAETTFFSSPPADCPSDIRRRFAELTAGTVFSYAPDEAAMHAAAASVGDSGKRRPVLIGKDAKGEPIFRNPEEFLKR